ncbi:PQQ-binding-like beta-propeller repeat protein, partial [Christensenellaceae bacterium OttesenSCG-928-M15]|nr:PQQ-binding-like beta-propeller repeat protein [Christensenellaceae bacterium OttesenSCG-928-M15]
ESASSYSRSTPISFKKAEDYNALPGVLTFRGNNYRDTPSYGTATVEKKTLKLSWTVNTGSMPKGISGSGSWSGSGWVGQPLLVEWPKSTKMIMNMYDSAKQKDSLVEVILATMDGYVYFTDLETGEATRDKLKINMPFKGAGSIDPRGYPILYLGSGDGYDNDKQDTRALVYSLVDFTRLYEFGKRKDSFTLRSWHAYDSAPLVDAQADTLFYPGENGILYSVKLNTKYDEAAGTLTMDPGEMVKYRYSAKRTGDSKYWLGYEDSAVGWGEYLYLSDNAGLMQCINVNTMDIVWVQDTWDDTNGSPVLEEDIDNHTAYLYIGTSLHWNKKSDDTGEVAFFKIDAVTGETLWKDVRKVHTVSGVSGGIQATAVLGKGNLSDLVIVPFSRTPGGSNGILVALDKETGAERWKYETKGYSWSSPIDIYDAAGNGYIVIADSRGNVYLLDGKTGSLLDTLPFESNNFEASPAAFKNTIVLGSRAGRIYGITIE